MKARHDDQMKRMFILLMLLQFLVALQAVGLSEGAITPESKITLGKLISPESVSPGQKFTVNVSVTYSCRQRTMSNIGIYDLNSDTMLDPRVFYLEGNGSKSFLLNLRAPPAEGELKLEALLRYWYAERWIYENESLHRTFSVRISGHESLEMTLELPIKDAVIRINDAKIKTDSLGVAKIRTKPGRYRIEVPQIINLTADSRLSFLKWSDGATSNPLILEINGDTALDAEYGTEYYLTVKSSLSSIQGEGWYPVDFNATISVPRSVYGPADSWIVPEKYVFKSWRGDSGASASSTQIKMASPKTVEAEWQIEQTPRLHVTALVLIIICNIGIVGVILSRMRNHA
jgi:hypothetical protein